MNLFIDTNIVLDLLAQRKPFYDDAAKLFSEADKGNITLSVNALTIANTNYILSKFTTFKNSKTTIKQFRSLVTIQPLSDKIIDAALADEEFLDFEDCLQYQSALSSKQDYIISRDIKGYKKSRIPVITAREFLIQNKLIS